MEESVDFINQLKEQLRNKAEWFNSQQLPAMLNHYRLLHTCVKNLYEVLVKKSLITPDPYKLESKISDIVCPEDSPYIESERSLVIGARFSNYESMLDFVCTYLKFSTDSINIPRIKKLTDLNNAFQWSNMTLNNSKTNTRGLATLIQEARRNAPQMTLSLINDSISKSCQAIQEITEILKELMSFQREAYKLQIRMDVIGHPKFDKSAIGNTPAEELAEIKKNFAAVMGKTPFYSELINEIANEDLAPNRKTLQEQVLRTLEIKEKVKTKKVEKVDYSALLYDSLSSLSGLSDIYETIAKKLEENVGILEGAKNSLWQKIKKAFRIAFNIPEPPVIYNFILMDPKKNTKTSRSVDMNVFIVNILRKSSFYGPLANKNGPEFNKIKSNPEEKVLEFLNKNLSENQEILTLLDAADEYFKNNTSSQDRSKIKGLKMDLITVKNVIVKSIQKRSDYCNYIEEKEQMKKLGITDENE